ncbi:MAG: hypothetical protein OIN83_12590 [Candidatus Methanoperedens sp.]|nr:hypothetical protein [Candidatus Methanoperedens sp.]
MNMILSKHGQIIFKYKYSMLGSCFLVSLGLLFFSSSGQDDAHITYWSAYALSNFGEIVNYNGDRIEQSSSFLHVLLLALFSRITKIDITFIGILFSMFLGVLTIITTEISSNLLGSRFSKISPLILGTTTYFVYWSFGGLESTLMAFVSILLLLSYSSFLKRKSHFPGFMVWFSTALFLLTRPETIIVLFVLLLAYMILCIISNIVIKKKESLFLKELIKKIGILMIAALIASAILFLFRYLYFHSLFPQPVYAKSDGISLDSIFAGLGYFNKYLFEDIDSIHLAIITILSFIASLRVIYGFLKNREPFIKNPLLALFALFYLTYAGFIIAVGGDWMGGGRFLIPIIPIGMILSIDLFTKFSGQKSLVIALISVLIFTQIIGLVNFADKQSTGMPLWTYPDLNDKIILEEKNNFSFFEKTNRIHLRDILIIHELKKLLPDILKERDNVIIMSGQAGMVPYHIFKKNFGRIRFIDRLGLTTNDFTTCRITSKKSKNYLGIQIGYRFYFKYGQQIIDKCNIPMPDIIYDIDSNDFLRAKLAENNGYTIIYKQYGYIETHSKLRGRVVRANTFIAVRNDLMNSAMSFNSYNVSPT